MPSSPDGDGKIKTTESPEFKIPKITQMNQTMDLKFHIDKFEKAQKKVSEANRSKNHSKLKNHKNDNDFIDDPKKFENSDYDFDHKKDKVFDNTMKTAVGQEHQNLNHDS